MARIKLLRVVIDLVTGLKMRLFSMFQGFEYRVKWAELFPTRISYVVFIVYVVLFCNLGLLTHATKNTSGEYDYDPAVVVLLTEATKLSISMVIILRTDSLGEMIGICTKNLQMFLLYMVPSGL